MNVSNIDFVDTEALISEFNFVTSRSGGSGGQHVNKVETKVTAQINISRSKVLTEDQKAILQEKLKKRLSNSGVLSMYCQAARSQIKNKERVTQNLVRFLKKSLRQKKKRKATRATKESKEKTLKNKKKRSEVKKLRKKPEF